MEDTLIIDLKLSESVKTRPFNKHWQFCVGSCHASLAARSDYARQLKHIHDELGIEYVRFHGIFCDDMHTISDFTDVLPIPGGERFREVDFYRCGLAYDNVLASGMKPFVELSFMPSTLAKNPKHGKAFYGSNFSTPRDYDEWRGYIQAFVRYLLNRYGKEEIESWYFEVWNEPDLQGMFFKGTMNDYFKLYDVTARAIKDVNSNLRVGGPATSGSKWIKSFVDHCEKNRVPVDFVSTHQYAGDPFQGISDCGGPESDVDEIPSEQPDMSAFAAAAQMFSQLQQTMPLLDVIRTMFGDPTETKEIPNDTFRRNAAIVKRQADGIPLFYTEWNLDSTFGAESNDTRKVAAYLVKAALDIEQSVTGSSVWCFSDIFEELHQFTREFHGGYGLQTVNGIP